MAQDGRIVERVLWHCFRPLLRRAGHGVRRPKLRSIRPTFFPPPQPSTLLTVAMVLRVLAHEEAQCLGSTCFPQPLYRADPFEATRSLPMAASKELLLVLNAGSSSLKYALFGITGSPGRWSRLVHGLAEGISTKTECRIKEETHEGKKVHKVDLPDHRTALSRVVDLLPGKDNISSVGHRVVHGGESFKSAALINQTVLKAVRDASVLAPLHNPWNILGIEVAAELFGQNCPQVAVFDTAFHQTMPPYAYMYALPYDLYKNHHVRKYGFHGTSYLYVAEETARVLNKPLSKLNIIACHVGNGASMCAIKQGKCVDTTMGLTPLEGLVMGTRCGDIDPAVPIHLMDQLGYTAKEVNNLMNKASARV